MTSVLKSQSVDIEMLTSAAQLPDDYLSEEMLQSTGFKFKFWFLTVEGSVDLKVPSIDLRATIMGRQVAKLHLDPKNPKGKIGGSVLGFKALAQLEMRTNPVRLIVDAELCAPGGKCQKYHKEIHF
jgi:hypothetical protein